MELAGYRIRFDEKIWNIALSRSYTHRVSFVHLYLFSKVVWIGTIFNEVFLVQVEIVIKFFRQLFLVKLSCFLRINSDRLIYLIILLSVKCAQVKYKRDIYFIVLYVNTFTTRITYSQLSEMWAIAYKFLLHSIFEWSRKFYFEFITVAILESKIYITVLIKRAVADAAYLTNVKEREHFLILHKFCIQRS